MVIYADELCEGDFARNVDDAIIQVTHVNVNWELELVFACGKDLLSDRVVILPPFNLANHVEVWNVR